MHVEQDQLMGTATRSMKISIVTLDARVGHLKVTRYAQEMADARLGHLIAAY
jgi:hypothetical protein